MNRSFNKQAYDAHDNRTKQKVVEIMETTGKFKFYGDLNVEHYKECDVRMTHIQTGYIVRFENECRRNFDELVNVFDTIHIPIRKKNTMADFYLVWNTELTQFIKISRNLIQQSMTIPVECRATRNATHDYDEDFLDIPKSKCEWKVVGFKNKIIDMAWPE